MKYSVALLLIASFTLMGMEDDNLQDQVVITSGSNIYIATKESEAALSAINNNGISKDGAEKFDINKCFEKNGMTPLHLAAQHTKSRELIRLLIKHGAIVNQPNTVGNKGWAALHYAAYYNTNPEIIKELIELGADYNMATAQGHTPLHLAASANLNPNETVANTEALLQAIEKREEIDK